MVQQNRGIDNGLLAGHRMDMENWKRRMPWYGSRADRIPCTGSAGLSEDGSQSHAGTVGSISDWSVGLGRRLKLSIIVRFGKSVIL